MVTYCNKAAQDWLGVRTGDELSMVDHRLRDLGAEAIEKGRASASQVLTLPKGVRLRMKQYIYPDRKGAMAAGTLLFTDVGEYYELLKQSQELAVSEQRLAIEKERNRIAQEVHDTTGHTLTMIRSLIKLIRVACDEQGMTGKGEGQTGAGTGRGEGVTERRTAGAGAEGEKAAGEGAAGEKAAGEGAAGDKAAGEEAAGAGRELEGYLEQAQSLAAEGIRQLRLSINHMRQGTGYELVTQGVVQLAESVKEIKIEAEIQGQDGPKYSHLSGIVYSCLREAVTNCLRYADASRMDVILKFSDMALCLYIFDDGRGCGMVQESHGLSGIRERVEKAGGQVRFLSAEREGFQIYMELPVEKDGQEKSARSI